MKVTQDFAGGIRDMRNRRFPLQGALLELIDNSVDEGASHIDIRLDGADLIVEDDGGGFQDIEAALRIGESFKSGKIGRYGVGLKHTCARYSNTTVIESRGIQVSVPWAEMACGRHDGDLGEPKQVTDDGKTRIILCDFRACYGNAIETADIRRTYQPLISDSSLSISVTGTKQGPLPLPDFTEYINEEITFDGRALRISGGIFRPNDPARKDWKGYQPYYNGRLIGNGKITNFGNDCGCANFSFMLHLLDTGEPWSLATNKDDVANLEELLEYLFHVHTREILERGTQIAQDIELKHIEDRVNAALNTGGNITRSARTPSDDPPRRDTAPGQPKRNTKTATTSGVYMNGTGGKRGRVRFVFSHLGGESMGEIQDNGKAGLVITANLDNPFIAANKNNDSVILFFAKLAHAMHRQLCGNDLLPGDLTTSILEQAGEELAFSEKLAQSA
jgi:hypothetical protein